MRYNIAVLPGDGIGPEVIEQALRLLHVLMQHEKVGYNISEGLIGAVAIDQTGSALPDATLDLCRESDAVLMGAVGHPKYDLDPSAKIRPEQGLLRIRKELGLYANIRPITTYSVLNQASPLKERLVRNVDFVVYRELTGGIYFGDKGRSNDGSEAFDTCKYSAGEVLRISHMAFRAAQKRRKKLTLVDKANILETSRLWREIVQKVSKEYQDVQVDYMFVDAAAMRIIQQPAYFDIILTENMFGDIITDEASVITGSIGMLPSASVGSNNALFEPVHGSYPEGAGKNLANPYAAVLSMGMMLEYLGLSSLDQRIRNAVNAALQEGIVTAEINPDRNYTTTQVGDWLVEFLEQNSR
ncbi:MAG: 3-isopropylmalate dehydrogenase [Bacteroides sp. SM23_62_1]|nr:MAG: 3-isopropylmalate dehydrogenase [Bacteroides sp. SM23_62_1]